MGTGAPSGAYYHFGLEYAQTLALEGIELQVRQTQGSVENLELLSASPGVDIALVQGGVVDPEIETKLRSLGSVYYEPLWVFHRAGLEPRRLADLENRRLAVGAKGSGTRALALQLLEANGIGAVQAELLPLGGDAAVQAMEEGQVDVAFLVASAQASVVKRLLTASGVTLMSFERADAYTRLFPFLTRIDMPRGVIDLGNDIPPRPVTLLATTANVLAREDLHPALIDLMLQALSSAHAPAGLFEQTGEFPSARYLQLPLAPEAKRFYTSGPPLLRRYLPFWGATLADRLKVMLLPFIALMLPLLRFAPPVYRWRMRSRIYRWYRLLLRVEDALMQDTERRDEKDLLRELDRIEQDVRRLSVPLSFADELYELRLHINLVRGKVRSAETVRASIVGADMANTRSQ